MSTPERRSFQGKKKVTESNYRVRAVDQFTRKTDFNPTDLYFENGSNNDYPQVILAGILNSPTGVKASQIMAKYIAGRGIIGEDPIVNKKKGFKLSDIRNHIARDLAQQYGTFIHRSVKMKVDAESDPDNPKISWETAEIKILPFQKCRIGKPDSEDNLGKIFFSDFDKDGAGKKKFGQKEKDEKEWYYPFSDDPNVIKAQIIADTKVYLERVNSGSKGEEKKIEDLNLADMLRHYRGQVLYENLTDEFIYPISRGDSVLNDMDTEFRISVFGNKQIRNGFLGKLLMLINSTDNEEVQNLSDALEKWLGVEDGGDIYLLEFEERVEDMKDLIETLKLESDFDDDQFQNTVKRVRSNILGAFNNVPEPLLFAGEGSAMFGNSGEQLKEMQRFYQDQTSEERNYLEKILRKLGYAVQIEPLIDIPEDIQEEVLDDEARAKANLRGSLQGVQGILQISQSVADGSLPVGSAVQILIQVYGYTEEEARSMIQAPRIVTEDTEDTQ